MTTPDLITNVVWIAPAVIQVGILSFLVRRKLSQDMPLFVFYTAYNLVRFVVLYSVNAYGTRLDYFYAYVAAQIFDILIVLGVIRELYANLFGNYRTLDRLTTLLFVWGTFLLIGAGIVAGIYSTGGEASRWTRSYFGFSVASSILAGGLLLMLFCLSSVLNMHWKGALMGVAIGMALYFTADLIGVGWRLHVGFTPQGSEIFVKMRTVSYDAATIIWVMYCARRQSEVLMPGVVSHSDLERWNRELAQFV